MKTKILHIAFSAVFLSLLACKGGSQREKAIIQQDTIPVKVVSLVEEDTDAEIIRVVMERQEQEFEERGLPFRTLWGRSLQLIDCQNLFCEVSKYARVRHPEIEGCSSRTRIKQLFKPAMGDTSLAYFFPPKWGLNTGR
ncbi:MAG: hypothetical protein EOO85_19290 [Pedobacter sp.]|nr:MAG: hypothetical protein EOO85_19290 [Pedobacter sp.]